MFNKRAPRNPYLVRMGSKEGCCERMCTSYVETSRSVRSLASEYGVSKSTFHRYVKDYAKDNASSWLFRLAREVAKNNCRSGASDSDGLGRYD